MQYWIGVASKNHIMLGVQDNFAQLCHGKKAPLNRMHTGDRIIYYSPKLNMDDQVAYQKFTALGTVQPGNAYEFEMFPGFIPFRKNVIYDTTIREVALQEINKTSEWLEYRSKLRFGHFEISNALYNMITNLMYDLD